MSVWLNYDLSITTWLLIKSLCNKYLSFKVWFGKPLSCLFIIIRIYSVNSLHSLQRGVTNNIYTHSGEAKVSVNSYTQLGCLSNKTVYTQLHTLLIDSSSRTTKWSFLWLEEFNSNLDIIKNVDNKQIEKMRNWHFCGP